MSAAAVVEIRGAQRVYSPATTVGPLSLTVRRGDIVGLVGSNGAGKTTVLRMLCGLLAPTSGEIRVWGDLVLPGRPARSMGAMIEEPPLYRWATGRQQLELAAAGRRDWNDRIPAVLDQVALTADADRPVRGYSQGMRQRVGLARALLGAPELLVLDEPTNGLDPVGIRWLRRLLRQRADDGTTIVVSSHMLSEMHQLVSRVVMMAAGRVVAELDTSAIGDGIGALEDAYFELFQ